MLMLGYKLDPAAAVKAVSIDLATADSSSLRYRLFPGDVFVRGEGVDLSAPWGWVPVLDFALSLAAIGETLKRDGTERFEFTESSAALIFRRQGPHVQISSTYAPGTLRLRFLEFREHVQDFAWKVVKDLCELHPRLALNPEISRYRPPASAR